VTREQVHEKLTGVFRILFDNESIILEDKTRAADIEGWDSLTHINLIVAVEHDFGICITTRDAMNLQNVGEFIDLITTKVTQ
jgi:acyl carrier protein